MEDSNITQEEVILRTVLKLEEEEMAEGKEQKGLYETYITQALFPEYKKYPHLNPRFVQGCFVNLFRAGKLYLNSDFTRISSFKVNEEFETHAEKASRIYKGYTVEPDHTMKALETTPQVKYSEYIELLKSKDLPLLEKYKWMFEGDSLFFDGKENVPKIAYISFPRSGNTYFRKFFESITNIAGGMDVNFHNFLAFSLQFQGLKGQAIVDDRVWMITSHAPNEMPPSIDFEANRCVFIVRSPLDIMVSFFVFIQTKTHNKGIKNQFHLEVPEYWEKFVKHFYMVWVQYHRYWIKRSEESGFPIYFMRYEDLLTEPKPILTEIFQFVLGQQSIDGTIIEQRISQILSESGQSASVAYQPRSGGFGKNDKYYTEEMIKFMKETGEDLLYYFGYANADEANSTGFFKFENHQEQSLSQYYGFKKWNEKQLKHVVDHKEELDKFSEPCKHFRGAYEVNVEHPGWESGLKTEIIE